MANRKRTVVTHWNETVGCDAHLDRFRNIVIRLIAELDTPAKVIIRRLYFEGMTVFHCISGRFRFVIDNLEPICIGAGEVLIIYPGHHVTIEAQNKANKLIYGILNGDDVTDYFNQLGYFDLMTGRAEVLHENVDELRRQMELPTASTPAGRQVCLSFLTDIMITLIRNMRDNGESLVFDAVREIRRNLQNGIVRIEPLCDTLKISRSYLHRIFVHAKLGTPADFIKREQLDLATSLLSRTNLSVAEIAKRAGFISTTHFATFVHRLTGHTPTDLRRHRPVVYK